MKYSALIKYSKKFGHTDPQCCTNSCCRCALGVFQHPRQATVEELIFSRLEKMMELQSNDVDLEDGEVTPS